MKTRLLQTTFGKLALAGCVIYAVVLFVFHERLLTSNRSVRLGAAVESDSTRIESLSKVLNERFKNRWSVELAELARGIADRPANADSLMRRWMAGRTQTLSVKAGLSTQRWPVLRVREGLWDQPEIRALTPAKRQVLFQSLFFEAGETGTRDMAQVLSDSILGFPVYTFKIKPDAPPVRDMTVKVLMTDSPESLRKLLKPGEALTISDSAQRVLWSVENSGDTLTPNVRLDTLTAQFSLDPFGWSVSYQKTVRWKNERLIQSNAVLVAATGLAAVFLLSWLLARWINRPFVRLLEEATEIGQGHFSHRIPDSGHPLIQKIVRLINFMAGETDRLRQINIGGIINDKVKTEAILRNIADGIVVVDADQRVLVVNGVAEDWFGFREADVQSMPVSQSIPSRALVELFETVAGGEVSASCDFTWNIAGESGSRSFQAHAARVDSEDRFIGVIAVIRDVTRERDADRIKTELVSIVAHELKSPMSSIYGFSELLLEPDLEEDQRREYAQIIMTESSRLTDLVNKFLDLSRLESGHTEVHINPFDLRETVLKVVDGLRSQIDKKQIKVITEIPDAIPFGMGDPDMIEQVISNLLSNAIKYSPKRSKIGIEIKNGQELQVSVIDNGYGIPKEELDRIFDKFYRIPDGSGEETDGTGLGLALVKEIIQRHGKTIQVKSRLGVGSVFSFTLSKTGGNA